MSVSKLDTTVYGRETNLMKLPLLNRWSKRLRRRPVQVSQTPTQIETPSLEDVVGRLCEGMVFHLGVRYHVSLWRGPEGEVVTIATAPGSDGRRRLVTHKATIEDLKTALLSDAVYDAVYEALQHQRMDVDLDTFGELVAQAVESVEMDDCTPTQAARLHVDALVRERRGY